MMCIAGFFSSSYKYHTILCGVSQLILDLPWHLKSLVLDYTKRPNYTAVKMSLISSGQATKSASEEEILQAEERGHFPNEDLQCAILQHILHTH